MPEPTNAEWWQDNVYWIAHFTGRKPDIRKMLAEQDRRSRLDERRKVWEEAKKMLNYCETVNPYYFTDEYRERIERKIASLTPKE